MPSLEVVNPQLVCLRAHRGSGDRIALAAYLGSGDAFDQAVREFADVYADLNERDFRAFTSRGE
jgi:hypothetical protein